MKSDFITYTAPLYSDRASHDKYWRMPYMHYHTYYELLFLEKGECTYFIEDRIISAMQYDVVLFPPRAVHKSNGGSEHTRTVVNFSEAYLKRYFTAEAIGELLSCFETERITLEPSEFNALLKEVKALRTHSEQFSRLSYVLFMLSQHKNSSPDTAEYEQNPAAAYINRHYNEILSIDELAQVFHVSKEHLCRKFKASTGLTLTEYINSIRINHACELLCTTDRSITDIALAVGFNSYMYFNRVFNKIMKVPPSEFRSRIKTKS